MIRRPFVRLVALSAALAALAAGAVACIIGPKQEDPSSAPFVPGPGSGADGSTFDDDATGGLAGDDGGLPSDAATMGGGSDAVSDVGSDAHADAEAADARDAAETGDAADAPASDATDACDAVGCDATSDATGEGG